MTEISTYQRLHPRAYLEKFLAEGIRPDGRGIAEFRALQITQGLYKSFRAFSVPEIVY
jgi:exosome complex component RRP43